MLNGSSVLNLWLGTWSWGWKVRVGQSPRALHARSKKRPVLGARGNHFQLLRVTGQSFRLTLSYDVEGRLVRRVARGSETSWPRKLGCSLVVAVFLRWTLSKSQRLSKAPGSQLGWAEVLGRVGSLAPPRRTLFHHPHQPPCDSCAPTPSPCLEQ